jgi:hypothetical protein
MNMSKKTEESGWLDETPPGEGTAGAEASAQAAVPPTFLAIEEHAKARNIAAPIFAAVRQMKGWSAFGNKKTATKPWATDGTRGLIIYEFLFFVYPRIIKRSILRLPRLCFTIDYQQNNAYS